MLEDAEEIENNIDVLTAAVGCTVEDVYRPLWEGAESDIDRLSD
jgi:hypothetical protein